MEDHVSELDVDNDQSILQNTQAVPSTKTPGAVTLRLKMPFGPDMEHTELAPEQFKAIAGKWCEAVRGEVKNRELEKQSQARIASLRAKEAQMAEKLPVSERAQDEQSERRIIVPGESKQLLGRVERAEAAPAADPLTYALQQLTYWEQQYEQLKTAEQRLEQWRKIVEGLST